MNKFDEVWNRIDAIKLLIILAAILSFSRFCYPTPVDSCEECYRAFSQELYDKCVAYLCRGKN